MKLSISDKIRAIALEGLSYAKDPYDIARYEKLLEIATQEFSSSIDLNIQTLKKMFKKELGCITTKLGVEAAVFNKKKQLLILNRSDNTGWCLPCGWVDVGETPATSAVREVKEETGLDVEAESYISISAKGPGINQNIQHQVNITVITKIISDLNFKLNHESKDYKWISSIDNLKWHPGHDIQAKNIMNFIKTKTSLRFSIKI